MNDSHLPITTEWWIETFGDHWDLAEDYDRTIRWPQAGDTWIGLSWLLEQQRVDLTMGEVDRPNWSLGTWLPHIRTRGQLLGLLEHLVYKPVIDCDPQATWLPSDDE